MDEEEKTELENLLLFILIISISVGFLTFAIWWLS